jgi:hypothetical protein
VVVQKGSLKKMSPSTIKAKILWPGMRTSGLVQQENSDLECQDGGNDLLVDKVSNQLQSADHHHLVIPQECLPKLHDTATLQQCPKNTLPGSQGGISKCEQSSTLVNKGKPTALDNVSSTFMKRQTAQPPETALNPQDLLPHFDTASKVYV